MIELNGGHGLFIRSFAVGGRIDSYLQTRKTLAVQRLNANVECSYSFNKKNLKINCLTAI